MSIAMFIYLADVLPGLARYLSALTFFGCFISLVILGVCTMIYCEDKNGTKKHLTSKGFRIVKITFPLLLTLGLLSNAIPSEKTMYMMAGASVTAQAIESETGKRVVKKLEQKLDEVLKTEKDL